MEMEKYHKINGIYKRYAKGEKKGKFIEGEFSKPEFKYLFNNIWVGKEKIDGTNLRIGWDGYNVDIRGRTDNANLHMDLIKRVQELFPFKKFESNFGNKEVVLYGEGYGAGIQKGGKYREKKDFILFDILINGFYLDYDNIVEIAKTMGLDVVEQIYRGTLFSAIMLVKEGFKSEVKGCSSDCMAEGLVLVPEIYLTNKFGERIITKLKTKDWE